MTFHTTKNPRGGITVSKKAPVEPDWHKQLLPIAKIAGAYKAIHSPEVIAFRNLCRRLKSAGTLLDWKVNGGAVVYSVEWTARDPHWSGRA